MLGSNGPKQEQARVRETQGEKECLPERPMKIVSRPSPITWQLLRDLSKILMENDPLASHAPLHTPVLSCADYFQEPAMQAMFS